MLLQLFLFVPVTAPAFCSNSLKMPLLSTSKLIFSMKRKNVYMFFLRCWIYEIWRLLWFLYILFSVPTVLELGLYLGPYLKIETPYLLSIAILYICSNSNHYKRERKELQNDTLVGLFKLTSIKSAGHVIRAFFSLLGTSLVSSPRCPQAYREHNCSYLQARHEDSCDFMIILCPSCKELMRANEQERHNERECPERTLNCKYCKDPFQLKNIKVSLLKICVC